MPSGISIPRRGEVPQSASLERALIGAALVDTDELARERVFEAVQAADFFFTAHSLIWDAIAHVRAAGEAVDVLTVTAMLASLGTLERADELVKHEPGKTEGYLVGCWDFSYSASGAVAWARIIRDYAERRRAIDKAGKAAREAYAGTGRRTGRGGITL